MELKIEYLPVESLRPYEKNARKHSEKDVRAIVKSIEEFGFDDPIGIWGDNLIVEGHGRLLAAQEMGMDTVPCIRLDHLTDEQRRAYALAHNRTAELSSWDDVLTVLFYPEKTTTQSTSRSGTDGKMERAGCIRSRTESNAMCGTLTGQKGLMSTQR